MEPKRGLWVKGGPLPSIDFDLGTERLASDDLPLAEVPQLRLDGQQGIFPLSIDSAANFHQGRLMRWLQFLPDQLDTLGIFRPELFENLSRSQKIERKSDLHGSWERSRECFLFQHRHIEQVNVDRVKHLASGEQLIGGLAEMVLHLFLSIGTEQCLNGVLNLAPEALHIQKMFMIHRIEERLDHQVAKTETEKGLQFLDRERQQKVHVP